jgi:hypothetical protein
VEGGVHGHVGARGARERLGRKSGGDDNATLWEEQQDVGPEGPGALGLSGDYWSVVQGSVVGAIICLIVSASMRNPTGDWHELFLEVRRDLEECCGRTVERPAESWSIRREVGPRLLQETSEDQDEWEWDDERDEWDRDTNLTPKYAPYEEEEETGGLTYGDLLNGVVPAKRSAWRHPIWNRGKAAFDNIQNKLVSEGWREKIPRLLTSSVADESALYSYLPSFRRFLAFCQKESESLETHLEVDDALVWFAEWNCYFEKKSVEELKNTRACYLVLYPDAGEHLPRSARALRSREKLQGGKPEREPL